MYSSIQFGPSIERIDPAGLFCSTNKRIDQAGLNADKGRSNREEVVVRERMTTERTTGGED
jgi:hypothetical protein